MYLPSSVDYLHRLLEVRSPRDTPAALPHGSLGFERVSTTCTECRIPTTDHATTPTNIPPYSDDQTIPPSHPTIATTTSCSPIENRISDSIDLSKMQNYHATSHLLSPAAASEPTVRRPEKPRSDPWSCSCYSSRPLGPLADWTEGCTGPEACPGAGSRRGPDACSGNPPNTQRTRARRKIVPRSEALASC